MLFYFTSTGNSLYVAKNLGADIYSIPQEMLKEERVYKSETIGLITPTYEFDLPKIVREFLETSKFEAEYFYIIFTYGMHHGGIAKRTASYLESLGLKVNYLNSIIMHDNAIIVFDMDEQRALEETKHVDENIAKIKNDITNKTVFIQEPNQEEIDFYNGYQEMQKKMGPMYSFPLYKIEESCRGCGICAKLCPRGCIEMVDHKPVHHYEKCINCMACIQGCEVKAIQFLDVKEPNPKARYRHPKISIQELIKANSIIK